MTVIDGTTNNTTTVATGGALFVAVNPVTNQIYVTNGGGVTVIDGATNNTTTVKRRPPPLQAVLGPWR